MIRDLATRWRARLAADRATSWLERRLRRERPRPGRDYSNRTRLLLAERWLNAARPSLLAARVAVCLVTGAALLLIAFVVARG